MATIRWTGGTVRRDPPGQRPAGSGGVPESRVVGRARANQRWYCLHRPWPTCTTPPLSPRGGLLLWTQAECCRVRQLRGQAPPKSQAAAAAAPRRPSVGRPPAACRATTGDRSECAAGPVSRNLAFSGQSGRTKAPGAVPNGPESVDQSPALTGPSPRRPLPIRHQIAHELHS